MYIEKRNQWKLTAKEAEIRSWEDFEDQKKWEI